MAEFQIDRAMPMKSESLKITGVCDVVEYVLHSLIYGRIGKQHTR